MGVKISETTKWTIGAQVDPTDRTESLEYVSVSAGADGKIRLAVNDGTGEAVNTYLGPRGAVPKITIKLEWSDKDVDEGDGDNGDDVVRRPAEDWFGLDETED